MALSPGQRTIGKVLEALHLQKLGEWVARSSLAVLSLDGVEREEPLYEAHFLEAAPGVHHVEMFFKMKRMDSSTVERAFRGTALDVRVEPGKVVQLLYTPQDGLGATLEVLGSRDA